MMKVSIVVATFVLGVVASVVAQEPPSPTPPYQPEATNGVLAFLRDFCAEPSSGSGSGSGSTGKGKGKGGGSGSKSSKATSAAGPGSGSSGRGLNSDFLTPRDDGGKGSKGGGSGSGGKGGGSGGKGGGSGGKGGSSGSSGKDCGQCHDFVFTVDQRERRDLVFGSEAPLERKLTEQGGGRRLQNFCEAPGATEDVAGRQPDIIEELICFLSQLFDFIFVYLGLVDEDVGYGEVYDACAFAWNPVYESILDPLYPYYPYPYYHGKGEEARIAKPAPIGEYVFTNYRVYDNSSPQNNLEGLLCQVFNGEEDDGEVEGRQPEEYCVARQNFGQGTFTVRSPGTGPPLQFHVSDMRSLIVDEYLDDLYFEPWPFPVPEKSILEKAPRPLVDITGGTLSKDDGFVMPLGYIPCSPATRRETRDNAQTIANAAATRDAWVPDFFRSRELDEFLGWLVGLADFLFRDPWDRCFVYYAIVCDEFDSSCVAEDIEPYLNYYETGRLPDMD